MKVPKQIIEFQQKVHTEVAELQELVARFNDISEKRKQISEIAKEYLSVKVLHQADTRRFLVAGIDIELESLRDQINKKIDHIYLGISCENPERADK